MASISGRAVLVETRSDDTVRWTLKERCRDLTGTCVSYATSVASLLFVAARAHNTQI